MFRPIATELDLISHFTFVLTTGPASRIRRRSDRRGETIHDKTPSVLVGLAMAKKASKVTKAHGKKQIVEEVPEEEVLEEKDSSLLEQEIGSESEESEASEIEGFESEGDGAESGSADELDSEEDEQHDDVQIKNGTHTIKKLDPKKNKTSDTKPGKKDKNQDLSGIVYVSRLPQGFKERELNKYFSQFGDLKQVRLARNKKTGNSRHYGFIEFVNKEDAVVAQETMDNYLILGHLLKVKVLPKGKKIEKLFRYKQKPFRKAKISKSSEQLKNGASEKHQQRLEKLNEAGIDFKW